MSNKKESNSIDNKIIFFQIMRNERMTTLVSSEDRHDKLLPTIGLAIFGLSSAIITTAKISVGCLIATSWIFFVFSFLMSLISFWFGYYYIRDQLEIEEKYYLHGIGDEPDESRFTNSLIITKALMDIFFFIGLVLFLIWVITTL